MPLCRHTTLTPARRFFRSIVGVAPHLRWTEGGSRRQSCAPARLTHAFLVKLQIRAKWSLSCIHPTIVKNFSRKNNQPITESQHNEQPVAWISCWSPSVEGRLNLAKCDEGCPFLSDAPTYSLPKSCGVHLQYSSNTLLVMIFSRHKHKTGSED